MRAVTAALLASSSLLGFSEVAAADTCTPARVMVVLDKSSSMVTGSIGTQTKWDVAVGGLGQVLGTYEAQAEFGLMTFPKPDECGPGALDVTPAKNNRSAILGALTTPPPNAGNWTPMAQTLEVAATEPSLVTAAGPRHVVLVTDGWQWCSPYDPATRFDGVDAVASLNTAGITTWVVGFGAEVDAAALNQMAMVANTARPNCNPAGSDPAATDNCYFQVDNAAELTAALATIAGTIVAAEVCDGMDNDCDGQIDEELVRDCSNGCGAGSETCTAGAWGACTAPEAQPEICDGDDNDCDGQVDEQDGLLCTDGEVCSADGTCQPPNSEVDGGAMQAGCDCSSAGGPGAGALLMVLAVGLIVGRKRRR